MAEPAIEVHEVHKWFGDNYVLRGVSLAVARGETLAIIGGSGSGKSVLLRHLIGLLHPDQGQVRVLGRDLKVLSMAQLDDLRQHMSMVFQGSALLGSLTVAENVGLALQEARRMKAGEIAQLVSDKLALVGMAEWGGELPERLSGGMRKRVALARALAMDPDIILYDEPTSELDPLSSATIDRLLLDMKQRFHKTSVVVTHDMAHALAIADRICMLHGGEIIFAGSPQELVQESNPVVAGFIRRGGTGGVPGHPLPSGQEPTALSPG